MPDCIYPEEARNAQGCLPFAYFRQLLDNTCSPPVGTCYTLQLSGAKPEQPRKEALLAKKESERPKTKYEPQKDLSMSDLPSNPLPFPLPSAPAPAEATELVSAVSPQEIGNLIEQAGGGGIGIAAALIAVVGGGAAFKFYSQFSKNRHEEKMERMRLESERGEKEHAKCAAERDELLAKIKSLSNDMEGLAEDQKKAERSLKKALTERLDEMEEQLEDQMRAAKKKTAARRKTASRMKKTED